MNRQSLKNRLDRIRDHLLPPGSMAWRVDRLPPRLAARHAIWRDQCAAIAERYPDGVLYEMMMDGHDLLPPMPLTVERALYPNAVNYSLPADATEDEAAAAYHAMLKG